LSEVLEVKNASKTASPTAKPASVAPAWPSSLYATPRVQAWTTPLNESFVAEEIVEGCRLAIQHLGMDGLRSVGVTSSLRGEGRTTIAIATALVLAEYGLNTILLELDLANPELAQRLAVARFPGLGDLAEGRAILTDTIRPVVAGLSIIPAGVVQGSIPRALSQLSKTEVLDTLVSEGHVIVADLPPLLGNSAGRQAAGLMADVILVVRARVVPASSIIEAVGGLPVTPKVLVNGTKSRVPGWARRLSGV